MVRKKALIVFVILIVTLMVVRLVKAQETIVKIGVLAFRGHDICLKSWQPTARYLSKQIKGYAFKIIPYSHKELNNAVARSEIDFILTNTGHYVTLETPYGISRIATKRAPSNIAKSNVFGAVIFTRSDRHDLNSLTDLRGKRFMGVKRMGFGGFQMAWHKLKERNIDPFDDFSQLTFSNFPQDGVAYAVRDGLVDAGTFRTGTLENMAAEGKIKLSDFKTLEPAKHQGFNLQVTTKLYPEWPFAKLKTTREELSQKVAIALLSMPADGIAARAGGYSGWTVPLDYQPVHDLFKELRIPPYAERGKITVSRVINQYGPWLALTLMGLIMMIAWSMRAEVLVKKRTRELSLTNKELANQITERQRAEEIARYRQAELARVAEMNSMGELASGIAHELNHPLATIMNYATGCIRRLRDGKNDKKEILDILERVSSEANRASQIISGLRDTMRENKRERKKLDVNDIVRDVVDLLEFNLRNNHTTLAIELSEGLPYVLIDPIQIEQVLLNLVGNGIEAMRNTSDEKRHIIIRTSMRNETEILVSINDNGPGIASEIQNKIFNPFVSTKEEGMGLGLSISCSIIKSHGGQIWIEQSNLQGTEFCFRLPIGE